MNQRHIASTAPGSLLHLLVCVGALVFVLWGLLSPNPMQSVSGTSFAFLCDIDDFLIHVAVFLTMTVLTVSLVRRGSERLRHAVIVLVLAHAVTTEFLQAWIPSRTCDPLDMLANLTGILLGLRVVEVAVRYSCFTSYVRPPLPPSSALR